MVDRNQLQALYPRAPAEHVDSFAEQAPELFERFEISTVPIRQAYFLAQIGHESAGLTRTEENLNYSAEGLCRTWPNRFPDLQSAAACARNPEMIADTVYADRMGNGPPASGDGWRYRGRGYIQITGRDGYASVGEIAGLGLGDDPDLAATPAHALHVACAFWAWKRINALCTPDGYTAVTKRINGGTNGMADRRQWLGKVNRILSSTPADDDATSADDIIAIQRALQDAGYTGVGAADGLMGSRTETAIQQFRHDNGLPAGLIDDALKQALGVDD